MPRRSCKTFWNEPGSPTFRPFDIALIYTALGERDSHHMDDQGCVGTLDLARVQQWEPRLYPLRNDPRFQELLRRIGLPA